MRITIHDVTFNVSISGNGPPLLLLHGFTGAIQSWSSYTKIWSKYYKVIAVDLIGHGKTDAPADPNRYTMDHAVRDLATLLDQLQIIRTSILGYSMGGRLALSFAATHPSRVEALLLESTSPGLATADEKRKRMKLDDALAHNIEQKGISWFVSYWENIPLFATIKQLPGKIQSEIRRQRLENNAIGLANSLRGMGTGRQPSWWDRLPMMTFPVLLITGELDEKFVNIAKKMHDQLPQASRVSVPQAGHIVHVEQPQIFDTIVREYLNQIYTQKG